MGNGTDTNKLNGQKNPLNMLDDVANLKNAGFEQGKAEAVVRMQYRLIDSHLATKQDIALIQRDIEELRAANKQDIALIQKDMKQLELKIKNTANKQTIILSGIFITVATAAVGIILNLARLGLLSVSFPTS